MLPRKSNTVEKKNNCSKCFTAEKVIWLRNYTARNVSTKNVTAENITAGNVTAGVSSVNCLH